MFFLFLVKTSYVFAWTFKWYVFLLISCVPTFFLFLHLSSFYHFWFFFCFMNVSMFLESVLVFVHERLNGMCFCSSLLIFICILALRIHVGMFLSFCNHFLFFCIKSGVCSLFYLYFAWFIDKCCYLYSS